MAEQEKIQKQLPEEQLKTEPKKGELLLQKNGEFADCITSLRRQEDIPEDLKEDLEDLLYEIYENDLDNSQINRDTFREMLPYDAAELTSLVEKSELFRQKRALLDTCITSLRQESDIPEDLKEDLVNLLYSIYADDLKNGKISLDSFQEKLPKNAAELKLLVEKYNLLMQARKELKKEGTLTPLSQRHAQRELKIEVSTSLKDPEVKPNKFVEDVNAGYKKVVARHRDLY